MERTFDTDAKYQPLFECDTSSIHRGANSDSCSPDQFEALGSGFK